MRLSSARSARLDEGYLKVVRLARGALHAMRELIVDQIRRRAASKRGGGQVHADLEAAFAVAADGLGADDVLAIDAALTKLASAHPRRAEVVTLRYFGGLSEAEIAEALGVTTRTVEREWRFARAWLHEQLSASAG